MEKSGLYQLIHSFSPVELREVRKFLRSPFYNQRQDLIGLFEWLVTQPAPPRETTWSHLFGQAPFDEQKLRLLMSYLHRLLEQYLTVKAWDDDRLSNQIYLAKAYRKRQLGGAFDRTRRQLEKSLEAQPLRNAHYHDCRYKMQWEAHQLAYTQNPTDVSRLRQLSGAADAIYLAQKLRLICLLNAHESVYQSERQNGMDEAVVALAEREEMAGLPAVAVYLHCYRMLLNPGEEIHFQRFKELLIEQSVLFFDEEMSGLFILAINYCVRRINAGESRFFREALDLYKEGLSKRYLLENGVLSRFTYHNIVAAGLHTGELDWVRFFIVEYKNRLEKQYRESSFSFNLARLEYAEKRYDFVLELLQRANYRDPLLNLAAKTLLLKTYYDLGEYETLQSHLDAMRNYIHRKRVLGYHRTNYLNIIRYTEKLMRLNLKDKKSVYMLRQEMENETVLTEKAFFQKILHVSE